MAQKFDWKYWRDRYVQGNESLEALASIPNAPSIPSFKKRSTAESWADLRKEYLYQKKQIEAMQPEARKAVVDVQHIVDVAEVITSHRAIAKSMKGLANAGMARFVDPQTKQLKKDLRVSEIVQLVKLATDIERLCMGLETEHTRQSVDLSQLSEAELEAIANGSA